MPFEQPKEILHKVYRVKGITGEHEVLIIASVEGLTLTIPVHNGMAKDILECIIRASEFAFAEIQNRFEIMSAYQETISNEGNVYKMKITFDNKSFIVAFIIEKDSETGAYKIIARFEDEFENEEVSTKIVCASLYCISLLVRTILRNLSSRN